MNALGRSPCARERRTHPSEAPSSVFLSFHVYSKHSPLQICCFTFPNLDLFPQPSDFQLPTPFSTSDGIPPSKSFLRFPILMLCWIPLHSKLSLDLRIQGSCDVGLRSSNSSISLVTEPSENPLFVSIQPKNSKIRVSQISSQGKKLFKIVKSRHFDSDCQRRFRAEQGG